MPGDVQGAGAHVALLAAAVQQRRAGDVAAEQQRADADRAAELVPGDGQRGDAAGGEVDRHLADRLDRVGVERHPVLGGDRGQLGDRLDGADLVVGPHRGDQRRPRRRARPARRAAPPGRAGPTPSTGSQVTSAPSCCDQPVDRVEHGVVLDRAGDHPASAGAGAAAGPEDALDGEVVALGAAAGEDHLGRAGRRARRRSARGTPRPARRARRPGGVQRRRVADLARGRDVRLERLGRASAWSRRDPGMPSARPA